MLRVTLLHPDSLDAARQVLSAHPLCEGIEVTGDRSLALDFRGDEGELAAMLTTLVGAGLPVTGFALEGGTLEDIFLQVTDLNEEGA
jgi:ABC-2 type transport system ATP-binding protein